jgi:hypothetical protein
LDLPASPETAINVGDAFRQQKIIVTASEQIGSHIPKYAHRHQRQGDMFRVPHHCV